MAKRTQVHRDNNKKNKIEARTQTGPNTKIIIIIIIIIIVIIFLQDSHNHMPETNHVSRI